MWLEDASAGRKHTFLDKEDEVQLSSWLTVKHSDIKDVWTVRKRPLEVI